ncbi:MAG: cell division protein FtsL [Chitinivibrionales bacterium]|nr:cell division protein FtsL [Chitinivibrionales bacterium]
MKHTRHMLLNKIDTRHKRTVRGRIQWMNPMHFLLIVAFCIGLAILIPLTQVWKQSYITQISLRQQSLKDSCAQLSSQLKALTLEAAELSKNERIEAIAVNKLHLVYPMSSDIIIICSRKSVPVPKEESEIGTAIRKSFFPKKG